MNKSSIRSGFTLVELMVGAAIIGILVGLLLPAVAQVRAATKRTVCLNNLRQMIVATHNFESAAGFIPPAARLGEGTGWHAYILPYIEREDLYSQIEITDPEQNFTWATDGEPVLETILPMFHCPVDPAPLFISSSDNIVAGSGLDQRAISSYVACASGTIPDRVDDLRSIRLEFQEGGSHSNSDPDFVRRFRSGAMAPTQVQINHSTLTTPYPAFETKIKFADILDGQSNSIMIGENIFDTTRFPDATNTNFVSLGSDHWYIGSGDMDIRSDSSATQPNRVVDDLSEFMSTTALKFNFYHANRAKLNYDSLRNGSNARTRLRDQFSFSFNSWHAGNGLNFGFADGSTKFIDADISEETRTRLGQIADGQKLDLF